MLEPPELDPLHRMTPTQYAAELDDLERRRVTPRWLLPDRMFAFPEPTHWREPSPLEAAILKAAIENGWDPVTPERIWNVAYQVEEALGLPVTL